MERAMIPRKLDLAVRPTTISVLILDSSGSMRRFAEATRAAVEGHINNLRQQQERAHICGVVGFADTAYVVIPLSPVEIFNGMETYEPGGNTLLWESVDGVIHQLREFISGLDGPTRANVEVVVGVFSDGDDNRSREGSMEHLQRSSKQVISDGWTLLTFGIGIDAGSLAEKMGFPTDPDHAKTVDATPEGVQETMIHMTQTTMGGFRPRTQQTP